MRFYNPRWTHYFLIALIAGVLSCALHLAGWRGSEAVDTIAGDWYFRLRGTTPPSVVAEELPATRDIIVIETNRPLPRPVMAKLITHLRFAQAVALDFMFVDRKAELLLDERQVFGGYESEWENEDRKLAEAIQAAGNVIVGAWVEEKRVVQAQAGQYRIEQVWEKPPARVWQSARRHAHLFMPPDERDGIVRRVRLFAATSDKTPSLALSLAAVKMGIAPREIQQLSIQNGWLELGERRIPVQSDGTMLIDYLGGRECFDSDLNRIVYSRALGMEPEVYRGKTIIVGESSIKSKEIALTPFGEMPGMHVHAHAAATLLSQSGPPRVLPLWMAVLIAFACGLALFAPLIRWPLWSSFVMAALQAVFIILLGGVLFAWANVILPASVPLVAIVLALNGLALYEYRRTRETLGRFIGREMVPQALHSFQRLGLGGREEEATAFFCDIRSFMALAEKAPSQEVSALINEYTNLLVHIVRRHGGRPIDFLGDGAFVIFERSRAGDKHALQAVRAALDFQEELILKRRDWAIAGWPLIDIGIGIASGNMTIGLVGAENHLKPGAVGDIVNVAARVQSFNFQCGYSVLVTGTSYDAIKDEVEAVSCGEFTVRGRQQKVEIYGIASSRMESSAATVL